jgi:hypothetical protein
MYKKFINIFFELREKHRISMNTYFCDIDRTNEQNTIQNWLLLSIQHNKIELWKDMNIQFQSELNPMLLQNILNKVLSLSKVSLNTLKELEKFRKIHQLYWNFDFVNIHNQAIWKFLEELDVNQDFKKNLLIDSMRKYSIFEFKKIVDKKYFDPYIKDEKFLENLSKSYPFHLTVDYLDNFAYLKKTKEIQFSKSNYSIGERLFFNYLDWVNLFHVENNISQKILKKIIENFEIEEKKIYTMCQHLNHSLSIFEYNIINLKSLEKFLKYEYFQEIIEALETRDRDFMDSKIQEFWINKLIEEKKYDLFEKLLSYDLNFFDNEVNVKNIFIILVLKKNNHEYEKYIKKLIQILPTEKKEILKNNLLKIDDKIILDKYCYEEILSNKKIENKKLKI